jgi:hypothetical protein
MQVEVLGKNEECLYREFIEKIPCCSAQCDLDWRNLICDLNEDEPYFVVAKRNNEILATLPLYLFRNKLGNVLTSNVWSTISGIRCSPEVSEQKQMYDLLLNYSISLAHEFDCSVLSAGTNPFADDANFYSTLEPDYILENFVQYIPIDEIFGQNGAFIHPNYLKRTNLSRNLEKLNQFEIVISDEQSPKYLEQAFALQEKRMGELGAHPYPRKFFDSALKNVTLKGKGKFIFVFHERKMIATCLFLNSSSVMDVYMLCMDTDFKNLRPNFAITKYLLDWAYHNKLKFVNWMSCPCRGAGVYKWKEQWGSRERTFCYMTKVTGDISSWRKLTMPEFADAYRFHYLLPYNLLNATSPKTTTKDELASFICSVPS